MFLARKILSVSTSLNLLVKDTPDILSKISLSACNFTRLKSPITAVLSTNKPHFFGLNRFLSHSIPNMSDSEEQAQPVRNVGHMENFKSLFNDDLQALKSLCERNGIEIRLAGGAVRDVLLGHVPHDIDFATTTSPDDMVQIFNREGIRMIEYGSRAVGHGTVTIRINDSVSGRHDNLRFEVYVDVPS